MTRILILGGGGMTGQKLAGRLASLPEYQDASVTLFDRAFPEVKDGFRRVVDDVTDTALLTSLVAEKPAAFGSNSAIRKRPAMQNFVKRARPRGRSSSPDKTASGMVKFVFRTEPYVD